MRRVSSRPWSLSRLPHNLDVTLLPRPVFPPPPPSPCCARVHVVADLQHHLEQQGKVVTALQCQRRLSEQ